MRPRAIEQSPSFTRFGLALLCAVGGCTYVPARFSASDPVRTVRDDYPVPVPVRTTIPDELRYSEAYVERAVVEALDPHRIPDSEDVNSVDEVPASSWFAGGEPTFEGFHRNGAPAPPLREVKSDGPLPAGTRVFVDREGSRWEVTSDEKNRGGMRPAAGAIASRLVWALGYFAAESYVIRMDGEPVLAVRYPAARGPHADRDAVDLGPTTALGTRLDDPNDVVDHQRRRTLRAFGLVAAWLGIDEVRPHVMRDVYVGVPGVGFVQHQVVGLSDALGVGKLVGILHDTDEGRPVHDPWLALGTLGFAPKESLASSATPFARVGVFPVDVRPSAYRLAVPFPAAIEAQLGDLYWVGKRIAHITHSRIGEAVSAGDLDPDASAYLDECLLRRRDAVARYAMSLVTPLEVVGLVPVGAVARRDAPEGTEGPVFGIELDDLAIRRGYERAATTHYEVEVFDEHGARLGETVRVLPRGSAVRTYLASKVLDARGYAIVRIRVVRDGAAAARSVELHLRGSGSAPLLRGVRH